MEGGKHGGRTGRCVDVQNLDYIRAKDAPPPLVGLPIGAGPEAPEYLGHTGSFEDCVLRHSNKGKQSQQATQAQGTYGSQQAPRPQQGDQSGQTSDNIHRQTIGGLLAVANDTRETRLLRLTHKKSASTPNVRLPWDGQPPDDHPGSGHSSAVRSKDGNEMGDDEEVHFHHQMD